MDDSPSRCARGLGILRNPDPIKKGVVYVVAAIYPGWGVLNNHLCVDLTGIAPAERFDGKKCGWTATRFRKLEEIQAENRAKQTKKEPVGVYPP